MSQPSHLDAPALWTRDFLLVTTANWLMFTSFYFLLPTLPVFVTRELAGDETHVGYIIGVLSLSAVLMRPISGYLLDRLGRKPVLLGALGVFSVASGLYLVTASIGALFALRALHGLSWGFTTTGSGTLAADIVPAARRGEGLGYYGVSQTVAMAIGPTIGLAIMNVQGFPTLFSAALGVALAAMFAVMLISSKADAGRATDGGPPRSLSWRSFLEPRVFVVAAIQFFIAVGYGGIMSFITLRAHELDVAQPGVWFLVYACALLVSRPVGGRAFDRLGPKVPVGVGFAMSILAYVLLGLADGLGLLLASAVTMGVGIGAIHPSTSALAIAAVPPLRRGAANATVLSAFDLGIGLGSVSLGALSKASSLSAMYLACAGLTLVPAALFFLGRLPPTWRPAPAQSE